ncbi:MAG: hypothetical protein LBS25_05665 [Candidatus Symbiothrix sp.]|jgi:hypothetical protein|nr:hypothetical protein [Candidatus Symbiothrix sp.]
MKRELRKISILDDLAVKMSVIGREEQRSLVGGGTGTYGDPYTETEFNTMCDNGTWGGGYVNWGGTMGITYTMDDLECEIKNFDPKKYEYYEDLSNWSHRFTQTSFWEGLLDVVNSINPVGYFVDVMSENTKKNFQNCLFDIMDKSNYDACNNAFFLTPISWDMWVVYSEDGRYLGSFNSQQGNSWGTTNTY